MVMNAEQSASTFSQDAGSKVAARLNLPLTDFGLNEVAEDTCLTQNPTREL
jgi:hypothetical protein